MLSREACERRVYRLAVLLTGDPKRAARTINQVLDAQPDLRHLDSAHMDRLTILRSREIESGWMKGPSKVGKAGRVSDQTGAPAASRHHVPPEIARGLGAMTRQQAEAWILHYVYRMMPREMAKAMDCSVGAIRLHLTSAESLMRDHAGDAQVAAGKVLLEYSMSLDVPTFHRRTIIHTRWIRRIVRAAIVIAVIAVILAAGWWVAQVLVPGVTVPGEVLP